MGVFNKTPYTNFHELNLNWIIKKIKEVAADNTFLKQFFKYVEDEHILGVVTDVTENNDNTVNIDYWNEDTQLMDDCTVYNKIGTDGAISGAVSPIATRVTDAEGRLDNAEDDITSLQTLVNQKVAKNVSIASGNSLRDFLANSSNTAGAYIINIQNATDNPKGTGNICSAIAVKHTNSGYVDIIAFSTYRMWVAANTTSSTMPASIYWYEVAYKADLNTLKVYNIATGAGTKTVTIPGAYNSFIVFGLASSNRIFHMYTGGGTTTLNATKMAGTGIDLGFTNTGTNQYSYTPTSGTNLTFIGMDLEIS